jgi:hypothetical protein
VRMRRRFQRRRRKYGDDEKRFGCCGESTMTIRRRFDGRRGSTMRMRRRFDDCSCCFAVISMLEQKFLRQYGGLLVLRRASDNDF